jgi:predicted GIY-YIG superfamily endonuclease
MTGSFEERIFQHKTGLSRDSASNTAGTVSFTTRPMMMSAKALGRERQLKGWRREKKIALIENDEFALARSR